MKKYIKHNHIVSSSFGQESVVFIPYSGQTHLLEDTASYILALLSETNPLSEQEIINSIADNSDSEEKKLLTQYIDDIIKQLVQNEIISAV